MKYLQLILLAVMFVSCGKSVVVWHGSEIIAWGIVAFIFVAWIIVGSINMIIIKIKKRNERTKKAGTEAQN